jgi:hypothetical protein
MRGGGEGPYLAFEINFYGPVKRYLAIEECSIEDRNVQ